METIALRKEIAKAIANGAHTSGEIAKSVKASAFDVFDLLAAERGGWWTFDLRVPGVTNPAIPCAAWKLTGTGKAVVA